MWSVLTRSLKMSKEQFDEEDVFEMTEDGRFDDETVEPEVINRLPRLLARMQTHLIWDSIVDSVP